MNQTFTNSTNPVEKQFGFWARIPLRQKLLAGFGLLFVFALIIAVIALYGLNQVQAQYEDALEQGVEMRRLSALLNSELLTARRNEKNFLLRWRLEGFEKAYVNYITPYLQNIATMRGQINSLAPFASVIETAETGGYTKAQYEADLATLNHHIDTYETSVKNLVAAISQKGSIDTGFEGEFRTAAQSIADKISDRSGLEDIEITYLQIRRAEKDYLERGASGYVYVEEVKTLVVLFKVQVTESELIQPKEKEELRALANKYQSAFDNLVKLDQEIEIHNSELINASRAVEPLAEKITNTGAQLGAEKTAQARSLSNQIITITVIIVIAVLGISMLLAFTISRQISAPIVALTHTAQEISLGKFETQADVISSDEIGVLAGTFNAMTARLRDTLETLNQRATQLATVAKISTGTATIRDTYQMLLSAVQLTQRGFNLYHAHVFTYNKDDEQLHIVACGYKEGDEHEGTHGTTAIPLKQEQSLVARAGRTRKPVIVNDVRSDPGWLPNPLLPDTRAELAVPMVVGDELMGVLDVQADHINAFDDEDANIQMTLAAQIATALQNTLSYSSAKSQADLEMMVNTIGQKIQRAGTLEDTLQIAVRELGLALGASRVKANIQSARQESANDNKN